MEGFVSDTEEERIAIIQTRSDEAVDEDKSGVRGEGEAEAIDVA